MLFVVVAAGCVLISFAKFRFRKLSTATTSKQQFFNNNYVLEVLGEMSIFFAASFPFLSTEPPTSASMIILVRAVGCNVLCPMLLMMPPISKRILLSILLTAIGITLVWISDPLVSNIPATYMTISTIEKIGERYSGRMFGSLLAATLFLSYRYDNPLKRMRNPFPSIGIATASYSVASLLTRLIPSQIYVYCMGKPTHRNSWIWPVSTISLSLLTLLMFVAFSKKVAQSMQSKIAAPLLSVQVCFVALLGQAAVFWEFPKYSTALYYTGVLVAFAGIMLFGQTTADQQDSQFQLNDLLVPGEKALPNRVVKFSSVTHVMIILFNLSLCIACLSPALFPSPPLAPEPRLFVGARYVQDFVRGQWISTLHLENNPPVVGWYGSNEAAIVEKHIEQLLEAHINLLVVPWEGINSIENDNMLSGLLRAKNLNKISFVIQYDSPVALKVPSNEIDWNLDRIVDSFVKDLNYLKKTLFLLPSYLHFGLSRRPIIFLTSTSAWKHYSRATFQDICEKSNDLCPYFIGDQLSNVYFDSVTNLGTNDSISISDSRIIPAIIVPPGNASLIRQANVASHSSIVAVLDSFNDWAHHKAFEPTKKYSDFTLKRIAEWASSFNN